MHYNFKKVFFVLPLLLFSFSCITSQTGVASTIKGKFFQSRVDYAQLLIFVNEYKQSPTADAEVVDKFREIDIKVQRVENEIKTFIDLADFDSANSRLQIMSILLLEIRNQLVINGIVKVEDL